MRFSSRTALALLTVLALPAAAACAGTKPADPLAPCKVPGDDGKQVDARCGVFEVWENRATRSGRKLHLKAVVLPALGPERKPDPIFYLAGGPGESTSDNA